MVTVEEAEGIIFSNLLQFRTESIAVENATGRTLAEAIAADRDFPPFDRVAMDGIAIAFEVFENGQRVFTIEATQAAGEPARTLDNRQHCIEVMTGAVLPVGTDTVIRYEDLTIKDGVANINQETIRGQNIHKRAADAQAGEVLLEKPLLISPAEVALLAAVGKTRVTVYCYPRTALISSGDELVDVGEVPAPHQIRRSNVYALEGALSSMGLPSRRYHFPDNRDVLLREFKSLLDQNDVLILSGGVSKGKFDYIPSVLEELGVEKKFHQVSQRPGKPFWFGVAPGPKVVFALPGNPVSTFMCFYRYIQPWIMHSLGVPLQPYFATLAEDVRTALPLTFFLQVRVVREGTKTMAYAVTGGGSGDFANLTKVTGFLELPPSGSGFRAGETFRYFPFRQGS